MDPNSNLYLQFLLTDNNWSFDHILRIAKFCIASQGFFLVHEVLRSLDLKTSVFTYGYPIIIGGRSQLGKDSLRYNSQPLTCTATNRRSSLRIVARRIS